VDKGAQLELLAGQKSLARAAGFWAPWDGVLLRNPLVDFFLTVTLMVFEICEVFLHQSRSHYSPLRSHSYSSIFA